MDRPDEDYFAAQATKTYFRINAERATGVRPEKESTKAAARIVLENAPDAQTFLDAGCSSGHLLRSLENAGLHVQRYVGVDLDQQAIESAREAWGSDARSGITFHVASVSQIPLEDSSVEVAISLNVLEHMRSLRPTLDELMRVASRLVVVRTSVWKSSYIIQEVRNASDWSGDHATYANLPEPSDELREDGSPREFVYQNMWGREYLEAQVKRINPEARVLIKGDTMFSPEALLRDTAATGLPLAAQVAGGQQVVGPLMLPHCWVLISLDGADPSLNFAEPH